MEERLAPYVYWTPYCIITHSAEVITSPFSFAQKLQSMPWVFIMVLTSFFWFPREVCVCTLSCLVVSDSLWSHGPARILCPLNFLGKNTQAVAISYSRGSSWPRNWICISVLAGRFFMAEPPEKSLFYCCASVYTSNNGSLDWWICDATVTSMDSGARLPGFDSWFSPSEVVTLGKSLNLTAH